MKILRFQAYMNFLVLMEFLVIFKIEKWKEEGALLH